MLIPEYLGSAMNLETDVIVQGQLVYLVKIVIGRLIERLNTGLLILQTEMVIKRKAMVA